MAVWTAVVMVGKWVDGKVECLVEKTASYSVGKMAFRTAAEMAVLLVVMKVAWTAVSTVVWKAGSRVAL
jgi:hypothetical protein